VRNSTNQASVASTGQPPLRQREGDLGAGEGPNTLRLPGRTGRLD
jgi:hypothetical protein